MSLVSKSVQPKSRFDPRLYGNVLVWYDGADSSTFTLSGNSVTNWRDKSSNAIVAVQDPNPPQRVSNGVSFNGTNQGLRISNITSAPSSTIPQTGGETICAVATFTGTTSRTYCIVGPSRYTGGTGAGTRSFELARTTSNVVRWQRYGTGTGGADTGPITTNVRFLATGRNTGAVGSTRLNGTDSATTATTSFAYTLSANSYMGCRYNAGTNVFDLYYQGTIHEIIMFNWITLPYLQAVEGYLANKWGLSTSLPVAHPYRTTVPFIGQFNPRTNLSNCFLWVDGADQNSFVLSGTNVSSWSNKGSAGGTFVAGPTPPTRVSNGVEFNGTSQYLRSTTLGPLISGAMYLYVITFKGSVLRFHAITGGGTNSPGAAFGINRVSTLSNSLAHYWYVTPGVTGQNSPAGDIVNVRILARSQTFFNTATSVWQAGTAVNGSNVLAYNSTSTSTLNSTSALLWLGATQNSSSVASNFFQGTIHEIVGFSNTSNIFLDTNTVNYQMIQAEGYLVQKWGLTSLTPATHLTSRITPYPGRNGIA
jgi:hypothetical protein